MNTLKLDAKILVVDQPGVTRLEQAPNDLPNQLATQQFECRGRVQDCSRGFLSWRATTI